jgi:multiple sugar transport system substrate-binding protein
MRFRIRWLVSLLVLGLLAAACGEAQTVDDLAADEDADAADDGEDADDGDDEEPAGDGDEEEEVEFQEAPEGGMAIWSRAGDVGEFTEYLAEQWNVENPDRQIATTIIPNEQYMTRVATAGAAGELPDMLAVDLIFMPDLNAASLMLPITDRVEALPYADALAQSHVEISEWEGEVHAVPLSIDVSGMVYRTDLFEEAGLDPDSPPESLEEVMEAAIAIDALGDDIYGFYFGGACGGCNVFTFAPSIWAEGGDILTDDEPAQANFDSPEVVEALTWLKDMWELDLIPASAEGEGGPTWVATFMGEEVGIQMCGSFCPSLFQNEAPDLEYRFALIPGLTGGVSSFGGGDVVGITRDAPDPDLAWEFIEWMLSEEVQEEHFAGTDKVISRTDLEFEADEATQLFNEAVGVGRTPRTLGFNELFNNPNSPWIEMIQIAVFEGDVERAVAEGQARAQSVIDLAQ